MAFSPPQSHLKFIGTALFLAIVVNLSVIWEVFSQGNKELYDEGQFIESLTAVSFLCGAVILFATSFFRQNLSQLLTISLAAVNLTGFLREVDVADYNVPSPISELASNNLKDTLLALVALGLIFVALKKYRHRIREVWRSFQNPTGFFLLLGGLLFLVSCVVEQFGSNFAEELLEANAAMAFLCGSLLFGQHAPRLSLDGDLD